MQLSNYIHLQTDSNTLEAKKLNRIVGWSLLTAGSGLFSFAFTCAMPFAGFASFAALWLKKRDAWFAIGSVWAINQAIGFECLNYPRTASSFTWGVAMGVAAFASLGVALWVGDRLQNLKSLVTALLSLVGAFATFKAFILIVGLGLNGRFQFSWSNLTEMLAINACAFVALGTLQLLATSLVPRGVSLHGAHDLQAPKRAINQ